MQCLLDSYINNFQMASYIVLLVISYLQAFHTFMLNILFFFFSYYYAN